MQTSPPQASSHTISAHQRRGRLARRDPCVAEKFDVRQAAYVPDGGRLIERLDADDSIRTLS